MPVPPRGSRFRVTAVLLALTTSCSTPGSVDGKYYNSRSGEFAMELKGGKVLTMQGQEGRAMTHARWDR